VAKDGYQVCGDAGGVCVNDIEGFYVVNSCSVVLAIILFYVIRKKLVISAEHYGHAEEIDSVIRNVNNFLFSLPSFDFCLTFSTDLSL
jgi:hypothetical protein